jgi:hypothetical protein
LDSAGDLDKVCTAVCSVCYEYSDGSGQFYAAPARVLFEGLPSDQLLRLLSASDKPSRQKLARLLQKIALTVGYPRCEGLESLRRAIPT